MLGRLADFPEASEVWLGSLVGEISVNPSFPVEVNIPGVFRWKVTDGQKVEADEVLGISDAEKVDLSADNLRLKQDRYRNSLLDIELTNAEKRKSLLNGILEMEQRLAKMTLTRSERELLGAAFEKRLAKERAELEEELDHSRSKLTGDYFEVTEATEGRALELDMKRSAVENRELLRNSEVLAPQSGTVVIEPTANEPIRKPTVVGHIVKEGLAEATVELADTRLRNLSGRDLVIKVSGEDGRIYRGGFLRELARRSMDRNARILVFGIEPDDTATAVPASLAGSRMVRVFRRLPVPGRIVPKKDLLYRFPKEIEADGWAGFIEKRWPGVKVTYVAPRELVVNTADEN